MKENDKLVDSLAYCGLICALCFRRAKCSGCKKTNNNCAANCYQKGCCLNKNLNGCWECVDIYKCQEGRYSLSNSPKVKAFAICIKEDGANQFIKYILRNNKKGWSVKKGENYDDKAIPEVLSMLRD